MSYRLQLCSLLLLLISFNACAEIKLKFGVYTSDKPTTMVSTFRPILNELERLLSEQLNDVVTINMQVAKNYEDGIEDLVSGKVDFARMGPASYIISKQQNPTLLLLAMESNKGKKEFYGVICVHENSPITHVSELKNHSFAFGNQNSTIGRYLSQLYLAEHGITAKQLSDFQYLERHDRVGTSVGLGSFDAGALKESTFKKLKQKGIKIKEIARFSNVTKPWIASNNLDEIMFKSLQTSLLSLTDSTALEKLKKQGFLPTVDSDYDRIRESFNKNDAFFK